MLNLEDLNISYLIVSPESQNNTQEHNKVCCDKLCSILYSKDYTIIPIKGYYNGVFENSYIAYSNETNDDLRKDAIFLMGELFQDSLIIKYKNEKSPKRVNSNGSEKLLKPVIYQLDESSKTFIYNGLSFSFIDQKRYQYLSNKSEIKTGMIVEFNNNTSWVEKRVVNLDDEYEKMYKLLMRYGKLRTCID
jgi:hypothetical protein